MLLARRSRATRASAQIILLLLALPAAALAQKSSDSRSAPHPEITLESPKPASHKSHKKDLAGPAVQLRYRIVPGASGVTAARIEIWDRPDLLVRIPVRVAKTGEVTWTDTSAPTPARLDFALLDPDSPPSSAGNCTGANPLTEISAVTVAGDDVPPSFLSDPIRVRAGEETMSLDLDGSFFTASTKVLLAEPTSKKDVWKAWEFLATEFIDPTRIRITVPWSYLASPRKLALWPFNLDELERAQGNGLPLNGTEQKTPSGGAQEILYVASPASPTLTRLEPDHLAADASDKTEAVVVLHGSGFTRASVVVVGRDPLEANVLRSTPLVLSSKFISADTLEIRIPPTQLRYSDPALSQRGPIRIWVKNPDANLKISEPRDIQILPTAKLPPAPPPGTILSISPSPLPLMTAGSPPSAEVTVMGKNFRANVSIVASVDGDEKTRLPTQFVSSTELHVALPRPLWREHRVSYRFVIVTPQGERATELYEDEDAPEPESDQAPPK